MLDLRYLYENFWLIDGKKPILRNVDIAFFKKYEEMTKTIPLTADKTILFAPHNSSVFTHEPTGLSSNSIDSLKDKVKSHYASIINQELNFFELKSKA